MLKYLKNVYFRKLDKLEWIFYIEQSTYKSQK